MRKTIRFVIGAGLCIQATSMLARNEDWRLVKISSSPTSSQNCTSVGMLHVTVQSLTTWNFDTNTVYDRLKMQAAEKNANLIVLLGSVNQVDKGGGQKDLEADGEGFICGSGGLAGQVAAEKPSGASAPKPRPPNAAGTPCGNSFAAAGSMIRGITFTAAVTHPAVDRKVAFERLVAAMPEEELEIITKDPDVASLHTIGKTPRGKVYPVDFALSDASPGTRIGVTIKLPKGLSANDEATRDDLCRLLESLKVGPAVTKVSPTSNPVKAESGESSVKSSVEERLKKLDDLLKKGLITKAEYDKKKAEILKDL